MGNAPLSGEAALRLYPMDRFEQLRFIEVEGELQEATGERWSALLRGAVAQRAEGIAVDLRGCRGIDAHSLEQLLSAATTMKARGGVGAVRRYCPDQRSPCDFVCSSATSCRSVTASERPWQRLAYAAWSHPPL